MLDVSEIVSQESDLNLSEMFDSNDDSLKRVLPLDKNLASYVSLMSEAGFHETLGEIQKEQDAFGTSPTLTMGVQELQQIGFSREIEVLEDIVSNPDVEPSIREEAMKTMLELNSSKLNIRKEYALQTLAEDSDVNYGEAEETRLGLAGTVDNILQHESEIQSLINTEIMKTDAGTAEKVFDFIQYFTPFMDQWFIDNIEEAKGEDSWASLFLAGTAREQIGQAFLRMDPSEQLEGARKLAEIINSNSSFFLDDQNDLAREQFLQEMLDPHSYTEGQKLFDNVLSMIDVLTLGAGGVAKSGFNAGVNFVKGITNKRSALNTASITNNKKAKEQLDAIVNDETDETAEVLAGTSREDAIADQSLPQIAREDNVIDIKTIAPDLHRVLNSDGSIVYSSVAKQGAVKLTENRFQSITGAKVRPSMSSFVNDEDGVIIKATYGPDEGGWTDVDNAKDLVKYRLRDYGVKDEDLSVLVRDNNGKYVPYTGDIETLSPLKQVKGKSSSRGGKKQPKTRTVRTSKKDFLVQVNFKHQFKAEQMKDDRGFVEGTWLNFFDGADATITKSQGSLTRMLFDPMSIFSKDFVGGAFAAVDKVSAIEKELLTFADNAFGKPFKKLDTASQNALYEVIKKQNRENRILSDVELDNLNINDEGKKILANFKEVNDVLYELENRDIIRSLKNKDNVMVQTSDGQTNFIGKEYKQAGNVGMDASDTLLDVDSGKLLEGYNLSELYEKGYSVVKLNRPSKIHLDPENPTMVSHVLVKNSPSSSYTRSLRESDRVLQYREGYYHVKYDAPIFITKKVLSNDGKKVLYTKAIGTARDTREAQAYVSALRSNDGQTFTLSDGTAESVFDFGDDLQLTNRGIDSDGVDLDLRMANGRSAQKYRGQALADSNESLDLTGANMVGPVDSIVESIRSVAARTATRPYLEAAKNRFMQRYGKVVQSSQFGRPIFPTSIDDIGDPRKQFTNEVKDARSAYEYINYLENGYRNALDDGFASLAMKASKVFAGRGGKAGALAERGLTSVARNVAPSSIGKGLAFNLFLVLNPLRQVIVQGHQAVQLAAIHPKYLFSGQMAREMGALFTMRLDPTKSKVSGKIAGFSEKEMKQLYNDYMDSGLASAIDKQALARNALTESAEYAKWKQLNPVMQTGANAMNFMRKIGFDFGEEVNVMSAWLAKRQDMVAKRGNFYLGKADKDRVLADARNFTYGMNVAGDMPYNQNMLNIPFQFLQVPHKAILQITSNKGLTKTDKAKLAVFSTIMYSPFGATLYTLIGDDTIQQLPEEVRPAVRDLINNGLETAFFNASMTALLGEEVGVDLNNLAPYDAGFLEGISEMFSLNPVEMYANSPAGSLMFGSNPRITNLIESIGVLANPTDEFNSSQEIKTILINFAKLSSGASNAYKARVALEKNKLVSRGRVSDSDVNEIEAVMVSLGFPTLDSSASFKTWKAANSVEQDTKADAKQYYNMLRDILSSEGTFSDDDLYSIKVANFAYNLNKGNNEEFRREVMRLAKQDANRGNDFLLQKLISHSGMDLEETKRLIRMQPQLTEEQQNSLIQIIETTRTFEGGE